ncbi:MAG TPA: radical SAM protein [Dehalococcoidia bacterium]|nr:radical SAM protein [Dehalococcoidia bacterium]
MICKETCAISILSRSQISDYTVNPYVGCQHACTYCYARFMKRFTGHKEPWGEFVDVKINAADLLKHEIVRVPPHRVWISGVCDPYQPFEREYELTKQCLKTLIQHDWSITIQTKSPLVLRDIDLFRTSDKVEVGLSVTSADDEIRKLFEPSAPSIGERLRALERLHLAGIRTYAMIAPMLPGVEGLASQLSGKVDYVLIDRMNYHYSDWVYRKHHLEEAMSCDFFLSKRKDLISAFGEQHIECRVLS